MIEQAIISGQAEQGYVATVVQGGLDLSSLEGLELYNDMQNAFVDTYIIPYFNILKDCGVNNSNNCRNYYRTSIDKKSWNMPMLHGRSFITTDGMVYDVKGDNGSVTDDDGNTKYISVERFLIFVDLNGQKGPNIMGRDVFAMHVDKNGNVSLWGKGENRDKLKNGSGWACNSSTTSRLYCGALIQQDGWQIKDDYLWK